MDRGRWKSLWLALPLCLAALVPLYLQREARDGTEPVQLEARTRPRVALAAEGRGPGADVARSATFPEPAGLDSGRALDSWALSAAPDAAAAPSLSEPPPIPTLDGVIEPSVVVEVRSSVKGRIEFIAVDRGEYVEAGDEIVRLESGVEAANVAVAEARARMEGELRSREATDALGQRRQSRIENLFRQDAISQELRDEVETDARVAQHELTAMRERRAVAALELQRAREVLARHSIKSPVSGYVVDRNRAEGEVVDEEVILSIAQVDPLRVELIAPASLYGQVAEGDAAEVVPELPAGASYQVRVAVVDRLIDAASGTFRVRLELPNPDHAIPSGTRCQVRLIPQEEELAEAAAPP